MNALFSRPIKQAKDFAWDMGTPNPSASDLLLQGLVKQKLVSIFRHHGAVETPRSVLFPRSAHYGPNAVQLLDPNGTLVQLPYDLTLSHARAIAKHEPSVRIPHTHTLNSCIVLSNYTEILRSNAPSLSVPSSETDSPEASRKLLGRLTSILSQLIVSIWH